jgi:hypothetical protein
MILILLSYIIIKHFVDNNTNNEIIKDIDFKIDLVLYSYNNIEIYIERFKNIINEIQKGGLLTTQGFYSILLELKININTIENIIQN